MLWIMELQENLYYRLHSLFIKYKYVASDWFLSYYLLLSTAQRK